MATDRVRIYDLARELGTSNKDLINTLKEKLNVEVKSHSSTISKEEAESVKKYITVAPAKQEALPAKKETTEVEPPKVKDKPPEVKPERIIEKQLPRQGQHQEPRGQQRPYGSAPLRHDTPRKYPDQRPAHSSDDRRPYKQFHKPITPSISSSDGTNVQDKPYHISGDKYRHRPDGRQEGRFEGRTDNRPDGRTDAPPGRFHDRDRRPGYQRPPQGPRPQQGPPGRFAPQQRTDFRSPRPETRFQEKGEIKDRPKFSPQQPAKEMGDKSNSAPTAFKPPRSPHKKDSLRKKDYYQKEKFQDLKPLTEVFKKKRPEKKEVVIEKPTEVYIGGPLTIAELGELLLTNPTEIIKELMKMNILATVNETISTEAAKSVSEKLGYTVLTEAKEPEIEPPKTDLVIEKAETEDKELVPRAPIVTILGHVDHGKTTLLDTIRRSKTRIVDTEVGGITQSIGAYSVEYENKKIVFIDTPGHHAFTAMRARGAQATDIAILIVAADDGIMPQTVEAINHAKAAKVPIIVAINKTDKQGVDPDRILQQLTEHGLVPEAWGGDVVTVRISALKGTNIEELLEMILLVAELQELKADPSKPANGVVIESELDKGKGALARVIVQDGTLKVGDFMAVGSVAGKVRALINDIGERIDEAGPSTPVEILGLSEVPQAGDLFEVVIDDKTLKQIINKRKLEDKERRLGTVSTVKLQQETIFKAKQQKSKTDQIKELNIIIKADTDGSVKAVETALQELKSKEVLVKTIHSGVGDITEADLMLAATSSSMIIGFRVKEDPNLKKDTFSEEINIRTYEIIYQISEDIEKTMLGLLKPELKEVELGTAEVRNLFTFDNLVIAGCYVLEGKIVRNRTATVLRENKEIFKGNLDSLKRFKDDVKEVQSGFECGISFNKFNDLKEGDIIKVTTVEEILRETLN